MNIFNRLAVEEHLRARRLGMPAEGPFGIEQRLNVMWAMTGGKGFQTPPAGPKLSKGGKTRKELKAPAKALFRRNLAAEVEFRESKRGVPCWGIRKISAAIERREHLKARPGTGGE